MDRSSANAGDPALCERSRTSRENRILGALRVLRVLLALPFALIAQAQTVSVTDPVFIRAALVITTFDRLHADCKKGSGFDSAQSAKLSTWQADNGVQGIRARMPALAAHASLAQQVDKGADAIVRRMFSDKVDPCTAAMSIAGLPDAQFARVAPQLVSDVGAPVGSEKPPAPPAADPAKGPAPTGRSPGETRALLEQIDSFGFDTRPKMGVGGFITLDIYPVVLMKSGEALTDVKGLAAPGGWEAHRRSNPQDWTRWRREGGKLELQKKKGWAPLPFQTTYAQLPGDLRLDGLYRDLEGAGTIGAGGTQSVTVYDEYRFRADGTVERTGGAGSTAEADDASVATSIRKASRKGRYTVDGLTLRIRYEDGASEHRILIADPKDPGRAIWLDGTGYVKRGK